MRILVRLAVALAILVPATLFGLIGPRASLPVVFATALVAFGAGRAALLLPPRALPFLLTGALVVIAASIGARLVTMPRGMLTVAEARAVGSGPLEVRGYVVAGSIQRLGDRVEFAMADHGPPIAVRYQGVPPESFRDGMEVVARGRLAGGTLTAHEILVKCPDNYDRSTGPAPF